MIRRGRKRSINGGGGKGGKISGKISKVIVNMIIKVNM